VSGEQSLPDSDTSLVVSETLRQTYRSGKTSFFSPHCLQSARLWKVLHQPALSVSGAKSPAAVRCTGVPERENPTFISSSFHVNWFWRKEICGHMPKPETRPLDLTVYNLPVCPTSATLCHSLNSAALSFWFFSRIVEPETSLCGGAVM
jgi:hypothetical protein